MAFNGTYEITQNGKKRLVADFCTSNFNLNKSRWAKPDSEKTPKRKLLERISDENLDRSNIDRCNRFITHTAHTV